MHQRPGDRAPRVQGHHALAHLGARRVEHTDDGHTHVGRRRHESREDLALDLAHGAVVLAAGEAEPPHRAAVELADVGLDGRVASRGEREQRRRWPQRPAPRTRVALWPPNPNEFDSTGLGSMVWGAPDTTSMGMSGSAVS